MKIYLVGGYVRDTLLGRDPKDKDYVVVGSSVEEMLSLGYQQVGASFPVFLKDGCEYALARTERKTAPGYNGFETIHDKSVTLEDDLLRRDLTINSMALDEETGTLIDPYGGQKDLQEGVLRHTSDAFAEDPVRVLRTARFAARYNFRVADATLELMEKVAPELDHVPQERIWAEIEKGLMEDHPAMMFKVLGNVGAYETESLAPYSQVNTRIIKSIESGHTLAERFTMIADGFNDDDYDRCRIPTDCADLARAFNRNFAKLVTYPSQSAKSRLELLYNVRYFSRPNLFESCIQVLITYNTSTISYIAEDLVKLGKINAREIAEKYSSGGEIKQALFDARLAALE